MAVAERDVDLGDVRLEVIPDAGHCPQFESSGPWWRALASVLAQVQVSAP